MGRCWRHFSFLKGAKMHMKRVEKGGDGLNVTAGIVRAQALLYLRGKHCAKDHETQEGTEVLQKQGSSFLDAGTSSYANIDSVSNSSTTD